MSSIASPTLWFDHHRSGARPARRRLHRHPPPHEVSMKEAIGWSAFYVALPLAFGLYVWNVHGGDRGLEYYTGYLVEKTLSVDNLFVFMLLLAAFAVPEVLKQRVLLYGIIGALVLRGIFIALGAAALSALRLGVPALRRDPAAHRRRSCCVTRIRGQEHDGRRRRDARRSSCCAASCRSRRLRRHPAHRRARRGVRALTPFALVTVADARDRHRLRRRLGAGGLRHHRRPLPGLRDQRLRPARPARALLRARGRARRAACT